ncbi:FAD binding domain-containing protein [Paradesulfitobacterium ferrireducens]|uniref:FAD binding domain-containing protein n=1 Tax=Paradesulfitobacterium ferrireducens TaxID=2816476 RepID=UPI001A8CA1E8|nr:FAD binding domain-containing protein [Paradesulfitobacterium ferrireducens]
MPEFQIACPQNLADAITEASRLQGEVLFVNGGTDLILELRSGQKKADWLIDLSQVPELQSLPTLENGMLKLRSGVTFTRLSTDPLVRKHARCLAHAGEQMGSAQIRNRATLGGNIASASPAGDSLPALAALEAEVTIEGSEGARTLTVAEMLAAKEKTLKARELVTEILIPLAEQGIERRSTFTKIGSRTQVSIARLNLAAVMELEHGVIRKMRLAVGAIGKAPLRLYEFEKEWEGKAVKAESAGKIAGEIAGTLAEFLTKTVDQAIPGRHSQAYKRQAVQALAFDVVAELFPEQGLGQGGGGNGGR